MANWSPARPDYLEEGDLDGETIERHPETAWHGLRTWHMAAPAERLPLPLALTAWPASWVMHACHVSAEIPGLATASAATLAALTWWQHRKNSPHPRLAPLEAAAITGAVGGWITAADVWGPLAKPSDFLTWIYVGGASAGYAWLRHHAAVRAARKRRDDLAAELADKREWHQILHRIGLGGWHLQDRWKTNLGEERLLTGSPDNDPATSIANHDRVICEKLAHILDLPYGRVDLRLTDRPGELIISIRTVDMTTRKAAYHPMTNPWPDDEPSPFADWFPENDTIIGPKAWGFTPEDGSPQTVELFNSRGGRVVGVLGMTDSGKSNVLNGFRELITRCSDARLVQLNGAHMGDELIWEPLSALTLCGSVKNDEELRYKIAAALDALCLLVTNRSASLAETGHSTFQPTPEHPALGIIIDEVDEIVAHVPGAGKALEFLASKQRKAAIALVEATQRGTIAALGGGQVRANMSEVLIGLVARATESRHATGAESDIPDIREYSRGEPGYFQRFNPRLGEVTGRGRAFLLGVPPEELNYMRRLVEQRRGLRDWTLHDLPEIIWEDAIDPGTDDDVTNGLNDLRRHLDGIVDDFTPAAQQTTAPLAFVPPTATPALQRHLLVPGVPPAVAGRLFELLKSGPVTAASAGFALRVSKSTAHEYLSAFKTRGLVELEKRGRASAWYPTAKLAVPAQAPSLEGKSEYVSVQQLAKAAHDGLIEDLDEDAREVLEQAWTLIHGDAQ